MVEWVSSLVLPAQLWQIVNIVEIVKKQTLTDRSPTNNGSFAAYWQFSAHHAAAGHSVAHNAIIMFTHAESVKGGLELPCPCDPCEIISSFALNAG